MANNFKYVTTSKAANIQHWFRSPTSPESVNLSMITVLLSTPIDDFVPTIQLVLGPAKRRMLETTTNNLLRHSRALLAGRWSPISVQRSRRHHGRCGSNSLSGILHWLIDWWKDLNINLKLLIKCSVSLKWGAFSGEPYITLSQDQLVTRSLSRSRQEQMQFENTCASL